MKRRPADILLLTMVWASLSLGLFWTSGVILDECCSDQGIGWYLYLAFWGAVVWLVLRTLRRRVSGFAAVPRHYPWWKALALGLLWMGLSYLLLIPPCWLLGHWLVVTFWPDPGHTQAGLSKVITAIWLPIWWAPGIGWLLFWRIKLNKPSPPPSDEPA